jgi:hypothetical protein
MPRKPGAIATTLVTLLVAAGVMSVVFPARADGPKYDVNVSVDSSLEFIRGRVTVEFGAEYVQGGRVVFWLYPNRLAKPPEKMNAMNRPWIYPYDFNPGWMQIKKVTWAGKDVTSTLADVKLPDNHPLAGIDAAALSVSLPGPCESSSVDGDCRYAVTIDYKVRVPKRYGLFGRSGKSMLMVTGWYPLLATLDDDGAPDLWAPPPRASIKVGVNASSDVHVLLEDRYFGPSGEGGKRKVSAEFEGAAHVSLAVYRKLSLFTASCGGMTIRLYTVKPYHPPPDYKPGGEDVGGVPPGLPDVSKPDRMGQALEMLCRGAELLEAEGVPREGGKPLTVLEAPLRMQVASATENVVFMSDRIYDIFPLKRFWKFHDLQLLRAFFNHELLGRFGGLGHDYETAALEADFAATHLVETYLRDVLERVEYAEDILKWGSFISSIDYILYSPMVQFREAYFRTVAEKDWSRDEPWAFMNLEPRGKLIYEKLKDILGEEKLDALVGWLVEGEGDLYSLTEAAAEEGMSWFFKQWSTCYPSLNYRVKKVKTVKLEGGLKRHVVKVYRDGDSWIKEPVVVRFKLVGGDEVDRVWFEAGSEGTVELVTAKRLLNVIVDPEGRLFEDPTLTRNHPRFDNAQWQSLRPPVFAGFSLWGSLYEESASLVALFNMRRKYDLRINYRFLVEASSFGYGVSTWVLHGMGKKLDLNYSTVYLGPFLSVFYYNPDFGFERIEGEESHMVGATTFSVGFFSMYDTVYFRFNPDKGLTLTGSLTYHLNVADDKKVHHAMSTSVRVFYLHAFSGAHQMAFYGAVGGTFFDMPQGQLQSLSDRMALRGFETDETMGRVRAFAAVEYRHLWAQNLGWSILDAAMVEGIKGVLFVGGGTVSDKDGYDGLFTTDRMFAEAGYGIALLLNYLGAYPNVIELDLAVPVYPLPSARKGRQPLGIYLSFQFTY